MERELFKLAPVYGEARNVSRSDIASGVIWFSKPSGMSDLPEEVSESSWLRSSVVCSPCWPRSVIGATRFFDEYPVFNEAVARDGDVLGKALVDGAVGVEDFAEQPRV